MGRLANIKCVGPLGGAPDPNGQGGRTQVKTCPRPDENGLNRTQFRVKMRRADGDALSGLWLGHIIILEN
jgi:hypothetical protein